MSGGRYGRVRGRPGGRLLVLLLLGGMVAGGLPVRAAGDGAPAAEEPAPPPGVAELEEALEALARAGAEADGGAAAPDTTGLAGTLADREAELARKGAELARLREAVRRLEAKRAELETALATARRALAARDAAKEEERLELQRRLARSERELAVLRRDNLSLTERLARQREAKREIAEERARLRIDLENAERQITELTASLEQAWKERDLADGEVEARDGRILERERRLAELADRLAAAEAERDALRTRVADLEATLARADAREKALAERIARYRAALGRATGALAGAAAELERAAADRRAREAEVAALEEANAGLARALEEARELAGRYRRILEALRERFEPRPPADPDPAAIAPEAGPPERETAPVAAMRRTIPAAVVTGGRSGREAFARAARELGFRLRPDGAGGLVGVLEEVHFGVDSAELTPESLPAVARLAELLRRFDDVRATIAGHTDAAGEAAYNRSLSEARAAEVRRLLIARHGIAAERLLAVGYGEERPLASNADAEGRRRNRRVEVVFAFPPAETPPTVAD